jgi:hypothetical protein
VIAEALDELAVALAGLRVILLQGGFACGTQEHLGLIGLLGDYAGLGP